VNKTRFHYRSRTVLPSPEELALPIHSKPVKPFNIESIKSAAPKKWKDEIQRLEDEMEKAAALDHKVGYATVPEITRTTVLQGDIDKLLSDGIIRRVSRRERSSVILGTAFTVTELRKNRRRFIFWPKFLNTSLDDVPPDLHDILDHCDILSGNQCAATFDLTAGFYQYALPRHLQVKFSFKFAGNLFCMNRLPMGFKLAPALLEAVLNAVVPAGFPTIIVGTHIDNVRFLGEDSAAVHRMAMEFIQNCEKHGITLNEHQPPSEQGDWLGLACDYTPGTVALGPKIIQKLNDWKNADLTSATLNDLESLSSLLRHCSRILRIDLVPYYMAVKCYRRKLSASANMPVHTRVSTPANIWPSVIPIFREWISCLLSAPPVSHFIQPTTDTLSMFVDASLSGWGAVLFSPGGYQVLSDVWDEAIKPDQINESELKVVGIAAEGFRKSFEAYPYAKLHIIMDNTSALSALYKPLSHAELLSLTAQRVKPMLPNTRLEASYISTKMNPADELSRGKPLCVAKAWRALGAVGRCTRTRRRVCVPRRD
jgi:hypothetical protein